MLKSILNRFFKNTLYIKISPDLVSVTFIEQNLVYEDKPLVALKQGQKGQRVVTAVGADAQIVGGYGSVSIHNPFDHPRSCLRDFDIAEEVLRYFIHKVAGKGVLVRPIIVIHPLGKIEGGLTQIEWNALRELAISAGAREVYVWTGPLLDHQEVALLQFPESRGKLGWVDSGETCTG